jgi:diketogulonate reductase-like aldo/keto reductase
MTISLKEAASGISFPALGLGTWQMGGRENADPNTDEAAVYAAINRAIEAGLTHIDTAEGYAAGYTEELLGAVLRNHERQRLLVVSKWSPLLGDDPVAACEASLKRLGTDYLDAYLIHRNPSTVPIAKAMESMDQLVERGLVRHIGLCNFSSARQQEAQSLSANRIACNQVHYNLIYREPEHDGLLDYCRTSGSVLSAWRPMQYGELSTDAPPLLQEMCEKYSATPAQIAIAWLTSQDNVITLVQTMNPQHLEQNVAAANIQMSHEDIERIRNDYPDQQKLSNRITLDT